jgi:hypothetical protein
MSQTNAILGTAFAEHPDAVGVTIDPMGMMKLHFDAMPVFAGIAQRWVPGRKGRCQEIGLSELGGTPGFAAESAFIMNPNYKGPQLQAPAGGIRTTAMIQAENRMREETEFRKANGDAGKAAALDTLGLPLQTEMDAEPERPRPGDKTPVEGLVGFKMAPREVPIVPRAEFVAATAAVQAARASAQPQVITATPESQGTRTDALAELLKPGLITRDGVSTQEMLSGLILALDIGFNGQGDLKKMRAAVAQMADAVRKGTLHD